MNLIKTVYEHYGIIYNDDMIWVCFHDMPVKKIRVVIDFYRICIWSNGFGAQWYCEQYDKDKWFLNRRRNNDC